MSRFFKLMFHHIYCRTQNLTAVSVVNTRTQFFSWINESLFMFAKNKLLLSLSGVQDRAVMYLSLSIV